MSLTLLASNNASTVLASSINASATTLTVNTGAGSLFPSPVAGTSFFKLTLIDAATGQLTEIVHVTDRVGDVMTIERAQEGTAARVWSANDIAANMMTAGTLSYIIGGFQPLDATLTALAALIGTADKLPYFNGDDTAALTALTSFAREILAQTDAAGVLSKLGLGGVSSLREATFTASTTWTCPAGVTSISVDGAGAGGGAAYGGAGGLGGGGGGGAQAVKGTLLTVVPGQVYTITIGAGGIGGTNATLVGSDGGVTSIGSLLTLAGGGGGLRSPATGGAAGGPGGIAGQNGYTNSSTTFGGAGGGSLFGAPGIGGMGTMPGTNASGYGAGGGGGASGGNGGVGSGGFIRITW